MNSTTICIGSSCDTCNNKQRRAVFNAGVASAFELPMKDIRQIYFYFLGEHCAETQELFCATCGCAHGCDCTAEYPTEPDVRSKKAQPAYRPQRATPRGNGYRWRSVEKTTTTWGSPADKKRKQIAMRVKRDRKWHDPFLSDDNDTSAFKKDDERRFNATIKTLSLTPELTREEITNLWVFPQKALKAFDELKDQGIKIKVRAPRSAIRDKPCTPGFVEYKKQWPKL